MKLPLFFWFGAASLFLSSCENQHQSGAGPEKISELESKLAQLGDENEKLKKELTSQKETLQQSIDSLRSELEAATKEAMDAIKRADQIQKEHNAYKEKYRVSIKAKSAGKNLGELVLENGKTFKNAKISRVDDAGILITHTAGVGKINFKDLPQEMRDYFGYSSEAATRQQQQSLIQQAKVMEYLNTHKNLADKNAAIKKSEFEAQKAANRRQEAITQIQTLHKKIEAARTRITKIEAEIGERQSKQYIATRIYGRSASHTVPIKRLDSEKERLTQAISASHALIKSLESKYNL